MQHVYPHLRASSILPPGILPKYQFGYVIQMSPSPPQKNLVSDCPLPPCPNFLARYDETQFKTPISYLSSYFYASHIKLPKFSMLAIFLFLAFPQSRIQLLLYCLPISSCPNFSYNSYVLFFIKLSSNSILSSLVNFLQNISVYFIPSVAKNIFSFPS